jgi:hypothetical protein
MKLNNQLINVAINLRGAGYRVRVKPPSPSFPMGKLEVWDRVPASITINGSNGVAPYATVNRWGWARCAIWRDELGWGASTHALLKHRPMNEAPLLPGRIPS